MPGHSHTVDSFSIFVTLPSFSHYSDNSDGPLRVAVPEWKQKLKALLRGTFLRRIFFFASVNDFVTLSSGFF